MSKTNLETSKRGRPRKFVHGFKVVAVSMPEEMAQDFKTLGGSAWLQEQIKKGMIERRAKMAVIQRKAHALIDEIREQIGSDCEDDQEFIDRAIDALEDGEFLHSYFGDRTEEQEAKDQEIVETTIDILEKMRR